MEFLVLDENLNTSSVLDSYESILWTERYNKCGDFEICESMTDTILKELRQDYYIWTRDSKQTMIVEDIHITSDAEDGNNVIIVGRSLESILERRIIWNQTILTGNFQSAIKKLLDENIISPTDSNRKISNFIFKESTDPEITKLTLDTQYTGDNLYEVVCDLCAAKNIGFSVSLNEDREFVFELYAGANRSYDQIENPYVVFSPKFENIINSNYIESKKMLKTVTLVAGEGEGSARKTVTVELTTGGGSGLTRRELYTDARDISTTTESGTLSDKEYQAQLSQRGEEKLAENTITRSFEGEMDSDKIFVYGEDFFMGDIVQIVNEFGVEAKARVVEMIRSQDESGIESCPTFETVPDSSQLIGEMYIPERNSQVDYNDLDNIPSINQVELIGDKSFDELGLEEASNTEILNLFK